MSKFISILAASLPLVISNSAQAFEFTGGSIDLNYSAFTEDNDFATTALTGAVEFGFNRNFGVQFDLGTFAYDFVDESGTNAALHAIYHINETSSLGAFYGRDEIDGEGVDFYGVEIGQEFQDFGVEAYIGAGDDSGVSATVFGLTGLYEFDQGFGLGASWERMDFNGDLDLTRFAVKADFAVGSNVDLYAEFGSFSADGFGVSGSENFFGIGAKFNFGASRGATFEDRGMLKLIPGL